MKINSLILTISIASFLFIGCKKEEIVKGCTDPLGDNFNAAAVETDNSCTFQKRFLGEYDGTIACKGLFKTAFTMADMSIIELIKKDEVNMIIQSTIGPLPVKGTLTKDQILVDAKLSGLKINLKDLNPAAADLQIDADGTIQTTLTISADNKTITGLIKIALIPKVDIDILGIPFAANSPIPDQCDFTGVKR